MHACRRKVLHTLTHRQHVKVKVKDGVPPPLHTHTRAYGPQRLQPSCVPLVSATDNTTTQRLRLLDDQPPDVVLQSANTH